MINNLRDNKDGTCNCKPLMGGCFFTDGFEGKCDCKCHFKVEDKKVVDSTFKKLFSVNFHRSFIAEIPTSEQGFQTIKETTENIVKRL